MNLLKNKTVAGAAVVVLVLGLGYYVYSSAGSGALLSSSAESTSPVSQEILATLSQLRAVNLDPSFFSDPLFTSLSDFGVSIPPQEAGRRNPFAPVGTGGASTQTQSSASTSAQ